ncbi:MAG: hypothetical protein IKW90_05635 [Lachnospiraceae bacterium]|nr:hypothetical protein [Lachnospiraceae bacterium]
MGLFGKKKKKKSEESAYQWMTVDEALLLSEGKGKGSVSNPKKLASDLKEQLENAQRIEKDTAFEYDAIRKHMSDIQRFEALPDKAKAKIKDISNNLTGYEKQRQDYQQGNRLISAENYKNMELYADELPEKLKTMEDQERYLMLVKNDMRQLEGEKGSLTYEKDEAAKKKSFLIKFSRICVLAVLTVCILFVVLSVYTGKNMLLPIMVTVAIVCVYAAYFVVTMKECDNTVRRADVMLKRCVELSNKVKIKYVNTANTLDYTYEKYKCNSHQELRYLWQNYLKEKEEEKKYIKNTGLLAACRENLTETLREYGFEMPEIWGYQAEVFYDGKLMREFRNVLEERHRKLKAQLEFNAKQKASIEAEIEAFSAKYPEYKNLS